MCDVCITEALMRALLAFRIKIKILSLLIWIITLIFFIFVFFWIVLAQLSQNCKISCPPPNYKLIFDALLWFFFAVCIFRGPVVWYSWINATCGCSHGSHNSWDKIFIYTIQARYLILFFYFSPSDLYIDLHGNSQSYLASSRASASIVHIDI